MAPPHETSKRGRRPSLSTAGLLIVALVALVASLMALPANADDAPAWCSSSGSLSASSLPSEFHVDECAVVGRLIRDHAVGAVVPHLGEAVYVAASGPGHDEFRIEVSPDGLVTLGEVGEPEDATLATTSSGYDECDDESKNEHTYQESDIHTWLYNRGTTPSYLSQSSTESAMVRGTDHIHTLYTDCAMGLGNTTVSTSRQHRFAGQTTMRANISNSGNCVDRDGVNVVNWGDLPAGTLATACTWYFPLFGEVMESDIKFNAVDHSWTLGLASCSSQHDVEAVMTHERGHTFGLGHVSESGSPTMTMSPQIGTCSTRERTLGYGDMLGLTYK